jgi:hypothetical protein
MSSEDSAIRESDGLDADEGVWNGRRRPLQAALGQRDELFADLYGRAIDALG